MFSFLAKCKNISCTWLLDTVIGVFPWQKCVLMSHFVLIATVTLSLLSGFLINYICTLHLFTFSTHGVRSATEVPRHGAPTRGPSRSAVPAAGARPPAICQSVWGPGTETGETSVNISCMHQGRIFHVCIYMYFSKQPYGFSEMYFDSNLQFTIMILSFHPVWLKCYLVRPQTKVHPSFKSWKETCSVFGQTLQRLSIQNLSTLRNVSDMVCGGKM